MNELIKAHAIVAAELDKLRREHADLKTEWARKMGEYTDSVCDLEGRMAVLANTCDGLQSTIELLKAEKRN